MGTEVGGRPLYASIVRRHDISGQRVDVEQVAFRCRVIEFDPVDERKLAPACDAVEHDLDEDRSPLDRNIRKFGSEQPSIR